PGTPLPADHDPRSRVLAIVFARAPAPHPPFRGGSLYAHRASNKGRAAQFSRASTWAPARKFRAVRPSAGTRLGGFRGGGLLSPLLYSKRPAGEKRHGAWELQIIAARAAGEACRSSAAGGALHGVIAGVLLIGTLGSALRLAGVTSDIINVITGVLLVLSVVSASLLAWLQSRRA
ncbi:hypothetical protein HR12_35070, partial [Microbacterium sp. SUBG005]